MDVLTYTIERRPEGWVARPTRPSDTDDARTFATRDDAIRWCRDHGVIPEEDVPESTTPGRGRRA